MGKKRYLIHMLLRALQVIKQTLRCHAGIPPTKTSCKQKDKQFSTQNKRISRSMCFEKYATNHSEHLDSQNSAFDQIHDQKTSLAIRSCTISRFLVLFIPGIILRLVISLPIVMTKFACHAIMLHRDFFLRVVVVPIFL